MGAVRPPGPGRGKAWLAAAAAVASSVAAVADAAPFVQPRDENGRFRNLDEGEPRGFGDFLRWTVVDRIAGRRTRAPDRAPVPRVEPDLALLATPPGRGEGARLTWIGHATWLLQLDGLSILTDAIWGDIWPGISRNAEPGVPFESLPRIDAALVSHNHYDHLDLPTLKRLGVPVYGGLGLQRFLAKEGLFGVELGWWQSVRVEGVTLTFVPAQHFSRRGFGDQNATLWGGFVVQGSAATVYHAGDTALFSGFAEIGRRFPGIDAALLPIGAYDPPWFMKGVHLDPEEALRAFEDLGARTFLAMHWGTFKLTDEPLDDPPRLLEEARARRGIASERVRVPAVGETVHIRPPASR